MQVISSRNAAHRLNSQWPNYMPLPSGRGIRIAVGIQMQRLGGIAMRFFGGIDANT